MSNLNSVIPTGSPRATTTRRSVLIAVSLLLPVFAFFLLEPPRLQKFNQVKANALISCRGA